jgi:Papain-like cysteine protease AvrRpt2
VAIEFRIRFENCGVSISRIAEPVCPRTECSCGAQQTRLKSNHLGASFTSGVGGGGNPETGPGGGGNPETGPGGGGNPETGPGGGGNPETGPGGRGQTNTRGGRTGTQPCVSSGDRGRFQMQTQQEDEWCWAAVSASVERYFQPESYVTQCEIASQVIAANCCTQPGLYDEPAMLQDALGVIKRLRAVTGRLMFDELQAEIDACRPVCIRIAWDGGAAHFVTLTGYRVLDSGVRTVDVADPFYPDSTQDFDLFPQYYHGGGVWTATFLTSNNKGE